MTRTSTFVGAASSLLVERGKLDLDDDEMILDLVCTIADLSDCQSVAVSSLTELDAYLADSRPTDLIILDLNLGDTDGVSVLRRLHERACKSSIIVASGSILYGASYVIADPTLFSGTLLAGIAAMYSLGICLSSIFLISGREADHLGGLLNEPMQLLGGVFAPIRSLGPVGMVAIGFLPLAPAADALRQIAIPQLAVSGLLPVNIELSILVVMVVAFSIGSRYALRYIERVGREGGKLLTRAD